MQWNRRKSRDVWGCFFYAGAPNKNGKEYFEVCSTVSLSRKCDKSSKQCWRLKVNDTLLTNLFIFFLTELNSTDLKDCISENSLSSNASLPSVQSCRRLRERRVASWAVSFERLLQDPVGVKYFSVSFEGW